MSALPPIADIGTQPCDVRFVPKADIAPCQADVCFTPKSGHPPIAMHGSSVAIVARLLRAQNRHVDAVKPCFWPRSWHNTRGTDESIAGLGNMPRFLALSDCFVV